MARMTFFLAVLSVSFVSSFNQSAQAVERQKVIWTAPVPTTAALKAEVAASSAQNAFSAAFAIDGDLTRTGVLDSCWRGG